MRLGIPRLGIYSAAIRGFFGGLGVEVVMPAKVTSDIVKLGVMQSPDFQCFPFKSTLGQQIWALEHGATDLLMFSTCGLCRFKHYHELQAHTLRKLGYQFNMRVLTMDNFLPELRRISGASFADMMKAMMEMALQIKEAEERVYSRNTGSVRIGLVGEVYTLWARDINFDIVDKLQKMGANVHMSLTLSDFIKKEMHLDFLDKREEKREARELLTQELGGHGFCSIYNTIHYGKLSFDGVIHLMPLSCLPECVAEILVDHAADKYQTPLYRFPIDESLSDAQFSTRLETFVSMLKRRKTVLVS